MRVWSGRTSAVSGTMMRHSPPSSAPPFTPPHTTRSGSASVQGLFLMSEVSLYTPVHFGVKNDLVSQTRCDEIA